jgi:hypothetical protein
LRLFHDKGPAQAADTVDLAHNHSRVDDDLLSCRGGPAKTSAIAYEELQAEFLLEQSELLAHAGLRREELFRRSRDVQAVVGDREQVPELLEFHRPALCRKANFISFPERITFLSR